MTKPVMPILAAERMRGYREGLSTVSQVACDDAHEEGRLAGLREASHNFRLQGCFWFMLGFVVAMALSWLA